MFSRALAAPWSPANKIFPSPAALPGTSERFWVAQVHHAFGDSPASAGTSDSADPELRQPRQNNAATTIHIESARFLKTSPFILKSD
ncbi:unknown [Coraliomargarita sp. CAG:312]|nr:unknown [Coraliomargarita sp. CAG:312]